MIDIRNKKDCCGCSACVQVCPKGCISMREDEEGFWYPEINFENCINCGLCEKVCPINTSKECSDKIKNCYVAYARNDELRSNSSSGGIFSLLAIEVLNDGGIVFGVTLDENMTAIHTFIDKVKDLYKLQGSKYVQSKISNAYKDTKKFLEEGRKVLFTGTGCQIAGLKLFLRKEYTNLLTMEILCHGVPSPKIWRKYIQEKESIYNAKVSEAYFRDKTHGWKNFSLRLKLVDGEEYIKNLREDAYMRIFLNDICLRPSCSDCKFKKLERLSDITVGDCWGIQNHMPDMDDDKGTSVILVHSIKGEQMIQGIEDKMEKRKADVDIVLPPTFDSRKSVMPHRNREKFFSMLKDENISINELLKLLEEPVYKKILRKIKEYGKKLKL